VSGLLKLRDRAALPGAVTSFGIPSRLAPGVGVATIAAEIALAGLLLVGPLHPWPAWAAVALLATFTGMVVVNLARRRRPPCPCFGSASGGPISGLTVVRNGVLLALAVLATG
jgi:methylamine utilization protein MauE